MNCRSLVLLSVLLAGCSTTKKAINFESEFQNITSLGVLPFQVKLHRIDMDTTKIDTAGEAAAVLSLEESISGWNVHRTTSVDLGFSDPMQRLAYDSLCFAISREIYLSKAIEDVSMDSAFALRILDEKTDYAALVMLSGFSRSGANMAYSFGKTILVGLLTLGLYVPFNMSYATQIELVIINAKSLRVVYYDVAGGESNPRNKKSIAKYFSEVVKNFRVQPE